MTARRRGLAIVVAVAHQKGGVGRTTTVLELAQALERRGRTVLAVDADAQHNLTSALEPDNVAELSLNDVLAGDPELGGVVSPGSMVDAVTPADARWGRIDYVPSEAALASREHDRVPGREARIREALQGELYRWDWVLIDCPGNLGLLTVSALVAADYVLVVTEARKDSVEAVARITSTIATVRRHFNERLTLAGIVVNQYADGRQDPHRWLQTLRADYGDLVFDPVIPEREIIPKAYSERQPLAEYGTAGAEVAATFDQIAGALIAKARKGRRAAAPLAAADVDPANA